MLLCDMGNNRCYIGVGGDIMTLQEAIHMSGQVLNAEEDHAMNATLYDAAYYLGNIADDIPLTPERITAIKNLLGRE